MIFEHSNTLMEFLSDLLGGIGKSMLNRVNLKFVLQDVPIMLTYRVEMLYDILASSYEVNIVWKESN